MPGGILNNAPDVVVWAHRVGPDAGGADFATEESARVAWQVFCNTPAANAYDITRSPKLPPVGEPLHEYRPPPGVLGPHGYPVDESATYSYTRQALVSSNLAVVNHVCEQERENPYLWRVTVVYEGLSNPAFVPAEVSSEDVEYQDHEGLDVNGLMVANSAGDPILGGMPVDRAYKVIRVTRAIPHDLWDMTLAEPFRNTLNAKPFPLSRQTRWDPAANGGAGAHVPVVLGPGAVRLKRTSEQEVIRANTAAGTLRYWRVTAELHVDARTFRLAGGQVGYALHRYVCADAGYQELTAGGHKRRIQSTAGSFATEPQFLDATGRAIRPAPPRPGVNELAAGGGIGPPAPGALLGQTDYYATAEATPCTVEAPGLMANDPSRGPGVSVKLPLHTLPPSGDGTVVANADGSFTFTPAAGIAPKWVTFRYQLTDGVTDSPPVSVFILVNALPRWLVFDRYRYADWAPLAALLANW